MSAKVTAAALTFVLALAFAPAAEAAHRPFLTMHRAEAFLDMPGTIRVYDCKRLDRIEITCSVEWETDQEEQEEGFNAPTRSARGILAALCGRRLYTLGATFEPMPCKQVIAEAKRTPSVTIIGKE